MPFASVSMLWAKSGVYSVRKAIPADVRDEYERVCGRRWEAKHATGHMRPQEAKAKQAEFVATKKTRVQAIRDATAGRTRSLSEREALALAASGIVATRARHEDNPGSPERWEDLSVGPEKTLSQAHRIVGNIDDDEKIK